MDKVQKPGDYGCYKVRQKPVDRKVFDISREGSRKTGRSELRWEDGVT
jgi:hypothetical protein